MREFAPFFALFWACAAIAVLCGFVLSQFIVFCACLVAALLFAKDAVEED